MAEEVAEQILEVLDGRPAAYAVNAPLLTAETAQAIAPYLPLAETLGRFVAQLAHTAPRTLTLEIAGEPAAYDASSLVAAVLRGLLETTTEERVNLVNAGTLAKARGIEVVERKTPNAGRVLVAADAHRRRGRARGHGRGHRRQRRAAPGPAPWSTRWTSRPRT